MDGNPTGTAGNAVLDALLASASPPPAQLDEPAPDDGALATMVAAATRVPD